MGPHASGVNSILPKEHGSQFFYLPIIKHSGDEVISPRALSGSSHAHKPHQPDKPWETLRALTKMLSGPPFRVVEGRSLFGHSK